MKRISLVLLLILPVAASFAQRAINDETPKTFKDRGYFGFGGGIGGGTGYFSVALNPLVGYMISPQFSIGSGINYSYNSFTDFRPSRSTTQYGISPFVRYNFEQLFMYGEYNFLSTNFINSDRRQTIERLFFGLGYFQSLGGRGAVNAAGLYDVLYQQNSSPFGSPWVFRVFFTF